MTGSPPKLFTADMDGDFVLFLIGMRIRRPWKLHKTIWTMRMMARMMRELESDPDLGLIHAERFASLTDLLMVQYWQSMAHLDAYANAADGAHRPAWAAFTSKVGYDGDIGIWHETYPVAEGHFEARYGAMPAFGLSKAGSVAPLKLGGGEHGFRLRRFDREAPPPQS